MKGYNTRSVWIISAEIRYLLSEQKKFQNKSKNICEVYQSEAFLPGWESAAENFLRRKNCYSFCNFGKTFI